jgi:Grx4 family monothiol glutaredoxin
MATTMTTETVRDVSFAPPAGRKTVLLFWAPWQEDSVPGGPCDLLLQALAPAAGDVDFARVHAEDSVAVTKRFAVTAVPTFVLIDAAGQVIERIEGSQDPSRVTRAVQSLMALPASSAAVANSQSTTTNSASDKPKRDLAQRLRDLTRAHSVMLFIKGTPEAPRCGFSKQIVQMLQDEQIVFGSFDILQDEDVRQGLKTYSNWPTYPQIYVHGELQGGLDIMKELQAEGSLKEQLGLTEDTTTASTTATTSLQDRLRQLIRQQPIMIFIKGSPEAPQCGFSRQIVEILNQHNVSFGTFDILQDEDVRQGLKTYSDWPTYPQLYCNGELIGGLDIVKEMVDEGSLKETLTI